MVPTLQWTKTAPGVYERAIDGVEHFYLSACSVKSTIVNKSDWYLIAGVKLDHAGDNFIDNVKRAWTDVRYLYPHLASRVQDDRWVYRVADKTELEQWLQETLQVHEDGKTGRMILSDASVAPRERMVLHVLPGTTELVIQGPHTHMDGFGLIKNFKHVIDAFDRHCQEPSLPATSFGDEWRNLTPPLSLVCNTPPILDQDIQQWNTLLDGYIDPKNKVYLGAQNPKSPAGLSRTQWATFDAAGTLQIADAAREKAVSLAAVVQSAISLAACKHGGYQGQKSHATQGLYSAREYIDSSIADESRIVAPMVLGVPLVFELRERFTETAKGVSKAFRMGRQDKFSLKCGHLWGKDLPKAFGSPLPEGKDIRADAQLSYLGHIDSFLDAAPGAELNGLSSARCVDYWCSLDMLSANVVIWAYTFLGRLHITLAYNETFHSQKSMAGLLQEVTSTLTKGLDVDVTATIRVPGDEEWLLPN